MKKLISILILMLLVVAPADAAARKTATKKKTTATLTVSKGETRTYGDYLTTQIFSIKKGTSKITVEYPTAGNSPLVSRIRNCIKESLNQNFTGPIETPDALMKSVIKNIERGEELTQDISVIFSSDKVVTILDEGYMYSGGAHGMPWEVGHSFLVADATPFSQSMLPSFWKLRNKIQKALAAYFEVSLSDLADCLMMNPSELEYPAADPYISAEGIVLKWGPYEIAPYSAGLPQAVLPVDDDLLNSLSSEGRKFF